MNEIANPLGQYRPASVAAASESSKAMAEIQSAMMIAKMNPRDAVAAVDRILNACTRKGLAETAIYNYSRGGTDISGPSIKLAETIAQNWGNMSFGIRELENSNGESTIQAYCWDIETNTRREVTFTVPHIRYSKKGSTQLTDPRDIYEAVANSGSRRLRACILAVIPGDVIEAALEQCEITLKANADTSAEGIKKLLAAFASFKITQAQIEKFIQRRIDTIQPAQVVRLKKVYASLKDGMSKPGDWFEESTSTDAEDPINKAAESDQKADKKGKKEQTVDWAARIKETGSADDLDSLLKEMPEDARNDLSDLVDSHYDFLRSINAQ